MLASGVPGKELKKSAFFWQSNLLTRCAVRV
jgi:hypothetical protein